MYVGHIAAGLCALELIVVAVVPRVRSDSSESVSTAGSVTVVSISPSVVPSGAEVDLLECVWEGSEVVACLSVVGRAGSIYTKRYPDRLLQPDPRTLRDWPRQP